MNDIRELVFESERYFACWCQHITHRNLLIRSDKVYSDGGFNIDILCMGVEYQEFPTSFWGLRIAKSDDEEVAYIKNKLAREMSPGLSVFTLITKDKKYFVVAGRMLITKNKLHDLDAGFVTIQRYSGGGYYTDAVIFDSKDI